MCAWGPTACSACFLVQVTCACRHSTTACQHKRPLSFTHLCIGDGHAEGVGSGFRGVVLLPAGGTVVQGAAAKLDLHTLL